MNLLLALGKSPMLPLGAIFAYLGLAITTLHLEVPFLLSIHVELVFFVLATGLTIVHLFLLEKADFSYSHPLALPILLGTAYALAPVLASVTTADYLGILNDGEFKSLVKILFFAPCLYHFLSKGKYQNFLLNTLIGFYSILGIYFLYRFLILNEVRSFDLRPTLRIRHGDPNFLCLFFSMMVPVSLLQAWRAFVAKQKAAMVVFVGAAAFLSVCAFVTESRMGIIALLAGLFFLATREFSAAGRGKVVKLLAVLCVVVITAVVAGQGSLAKRFSDINDKSSSDRLLTYQNGIQVFMENPLFGAGMHKARDYFFENSRFPHFQSESKRLEVHNTYLNIAAELGTFGLLAFAGLLLWAWAKIREGEKIEKHFLVTSFFILLAAGMTVGVSYKDLLILQVFLLAALSRPQKDLAI